MLVYHIPLDNTPLIKVINMVSKSAPRSAKVRASGRKPVSLLTWVIVLAWFGGWFLLAAVVHRALFAPRDYIKVPPTSVNDQLQVNSRHLPESINDFGYSFEQI